MTRTEPESILQFWFGPRPWEPRTYWWQSDPTFDQTIRERYQESIQQALTGELDHWQAKPTSASALVVLLDQFTRNCYRATPQAFAGDAKARSVTLAGIHAGYLSELHHLQAMFFCLPLEHSESLADQEHAVRLMRQLVDRHADDPAASAHLANCVRHAEEHQDIIQRYGRFPHRNRVLGRKSSDAEMAYLAADAQRFGQ